MSKVKERIFLFFYFKDLFIVIGHNDGVYGKTQEVLKSHIYIFAHVSKLLFKSSNQAGTWGISPTKLSKLYSASMSRS